jgi:hypothetical protein
MEEQQAFKLLITCLMNVPILRYPNLTRDFIVDTDASRFCVGAVLVQLQPHNGEDNKEVVIAYTSKHLTKSQANWSTEEKELFSIIHATRVFYPYLHGRRFQIIYDNQALQWLNQIKHQWKGLPGRHSVYKDSIWTSNTA